MTSVCFYFQVHQPYRLKDYGFFKIGIDHSYEADEKNREILNKVADKCYIPANNKMLDLIDRFDGNFKIAFSFSGTVLEQFEKYRPDVLASFKKLVKTGMVEILSETYYHSLSFPNSRKEFERQVKLHADKVKELFGVTPTVFRNTELIFNNDIAFMAHKMGFKGILCEGVDRFLKERSPNFLYYSQGSKEIKCLLKNYTFSDDIAFRFSNRGWKEYPLTAAKFSKWVHNLDGKSDVINLFMDYETFGEHQWTETGIFKFLDTLPSELLKHQNFDFKTPSEVIEAYQAKETYDVPTYTSWADQERDLSAWLENAMQKEALQRIYNLEEKVLKTKDKTLIDTWSRLQTSDHFYYMSTKFMTDGDVHQYFSPYATPFDAYINYMNVLSDFEKVVEDLSIVKKDKTEKTEKADKPEKKKVKKASLKE